VAQGGRRLTAEDWAEAGLAAVGEEGLAGLAVEPLAVRLGTTKGSFYWHYRNRAALLDAVLALWEATHTDHVIAVMDAEPDPARRLRRLFGAVTAEGTDGIEVHLLAAGDHPAVEPVMQRVVQRRVDYLAGIFDELGFGGAEAGRRALLAYSAYIGGIHLGAKVRDLVPVDRRAHRAYVDTVLGALLA
jgi:AcrR family transcriptional regulator